GASQPRRIRSCIMVPERSSALRGTPVTIRPCRVRSLNGSLAAVHARGAHFSEGMHEKVFNTSPLSISQTHTQPLRVVHATIEPSISKEDGKPLMLAGSCKRR